MWISVPLLTSTEHGSAFNLSAVEDRREPTRAFILSACTWNARQEKTLKDSPNLEKEGALL